MKTASTGVASFEIGLAVLAAFEPDAPQLAPLQRAADAAQRLL